MAYVSQDTLNYWRDKGGQIVQIDGMRYRLEVTTVRAIYPYPHTSLSVMARPLDRRSKVYLDVRARLGDDWSTDVLGSFDFQGEVISRLSRREQRA